MTREQCRHYAAECLALAQQVQDPHQRDRLVQMAQAWNELAERVDFGNESDEKSEREGRYPLQRRGAEFALDGLN